MTLSATDAKLVPAQQVRLTATWSTSASGTATVTNGMVVTVAPGNATITATSEASDHPDPLPGGRRAGGRR